MCSVAHRERLIGLSLVVAIMAGTLALTPFHILNHDVTFLAWVARKVLGSAVYGRDIYDVNPPLAVLLYVPAALLAPVTGHDPAIRLWMILLASLSAAGLWQVADRRLRTPLAVALVLFYLLAFRGDFAQREQMAFLLCAPYVAGRSSTRGWALVNGVMAGVGFLIKPHFLLVPMLLLMLRRTVGTEERVIAATALAYAGSLVVFFQPYLFEMVPMAMATYWAITYLRIILAAQLILLAVYALPIFLAAARQPAALPYFLATLGFAAAAALQGKGFLYHFIPAWGFLALFLTATLYNERRIARRCAGLMLLALALTLGGPSIDFGSANRERQATYEALRQEIENAESFSSLSAHPIPVFPIAFYSSARFTGLAMCQLFIQAVAFHETGQGRGDPEEARRLALLQATRELARKPDLVVYRPFVFPDGETTFDGLAWLKRDEGFRALWKDYVLTRTVGDFQLYRRR